MPTRKDCEAGEHTSDTQGLCWHCGVVVNQDWYDAAMGVYRLELPWPPSVNHAWRNIGTGHTILSKAGREYRQSVAVAVLIAGKRTFAGDMVISIEAYPPDKRRRDLDNALKLPLDGLAKAGVYADDFQIQKLTIERMSVAKPGRLVVSIWDV